MQRTGGFFKTLFMLAILVGAVMFTAHAGTTPTPGGALRGLLGPALFGSEAYHQCSDIKTGACNQSRAPTQADYPQECFDNGTHILNKPYTCPEDSGAGFG